MQPSVHATAIGYFPKRVAKNPDWLNNVAVKEICSVSGCISENPDDWIDKWRHNCMSCFDSVNVAREIVPAAEIAEFDLFAYRILPPKFENGVPKPFEMPSLVVEPLSRSFLFLGFDVVSRTFDYFECSPLSCNYDAVDHVVNEYCLFDSEEDACRLAVAASDKSNGFEPGPYFVVEVWRQTESPSLG